MSNAKTVSKPKAETSAVDGLRKKLAARAGVRVTRNDQIFSSLGGCG